MPTHSRVPVTTTNHQARGHGTYQFGAIWAQMGHVFMILLAFAICSNLGGLNIGHLRAPTDFYHSDQRSVLVIFVSIVISVIMP